MYASLRSVLATAAACALLAGCGDSATNGVAILASDVVADAAPLADADTPDTAADVAADVAPDTTSTADAAEDAAPDVAPDVLPDAPADVDAATDLVQPVDAADAATAEDIAPDTAATDTADDTADADAAVDAVDAVDVADIADVPVVPACTSAADCGGDTPYCSPAGACVACVVNAQCPTDGAFCVNNACSTAVNCVSDKDCTPIGAVCDSSKGVCRECLTGKDCSAGQTCKANQCVTSLACQSSKECPGALVCAGGSCVECATDTDCLASQFCSQNLCLQDVCKPSAHCELNAIASCKANGGGWDYTDCGLTAICLSAACAPVICTPLAVTCSGASLATCNATGTQQDVSPCPNQETCVAGACTNVICTAGSKQCNDAGAIQTCSADGTQWITSSCDLGYACGGGTCQQQICAPGAKTCSGQKLLSCNALGLAWSVAATCGDTGQVCVKDACVAPICQPNAVKCDGNALATCNADSMGWTSVPCDDSNACTSDTCNPANSACAFTAISCDDGNSCTADSCSGGCIHAPLSGATCDDGSACTTGETCSGGLCTAPVASASVSTVAGSGSAGSTNGAGSSATFNRPYALARLADGSFVSSDYDGYRLRQIQTDGTVSTLAGTGTSGTLDGGVGVATFGSVTSIAVDNAGTLFFTDYTNSRIRTLAGGVIGTFAGSTAGFKDGVGTAAQFNSVQDVKFDANGTLWAADRANHRIRRIAPDGTVTTAAGSGTMGYLDGAAATAQFNEPCRIAPASDGSVYIADCSNYRIRKLSADGLTVSTVTGSGIGYIDGNAASAKFAWIGGLNWLGNTLVVSDNGNNRIRAVAGDGSVSTLAGSGSASYVDGVPTSASFNAQWNIVPDWSGALWIADGANQRIRKLSFSSLVCNDGNPCTTDSCGNKACVFTPVSAGAACTDGSACTTGDKCSANGKCVGTAAVCNDNNACTTDYCNPATGACVFSPSDGPCVDNNICTNGEHCSAGACLADVNTLVTVAGAAAGGYVDGAGKDARFNSAFGLAVTKTGSVYVSDSSGNRIRLVAPDGTTSTVAGSGTTGYLDGAASTAQFNNPTRMAIDAQGALLIADGLNNRIRKLSGNTVSTVAGSGTTGFLDGAPTSAQFSSPFGLVYTSSGVIYVADSGNHRIRAIAPDGTVSTLAGSATSGSTDGTLATATFNSPRGICQSSSGTLYVVDTNANNIRRIVGGTVDTLAGGGPGAVDGIGKAAGFNQPRDCTVDPAGNIYVTDTANNRLRKITPTGVVTTIAGSTIGSGSTLTATDGSALASVLAYPAVPAWAPGGTIWIADSNAVRKFVPANVDCNDGLPCTTDVCNGVSGACTSTQVSNGTSCDDGSPCTIGEYCTSSSCGNGAPNTCNDGDGCTLDSCDPVAGCQHAPEYTLPGCCKPTLWQTSFENDNGNGAQLTSLATGYTEWTIAQGSKAHIGLGSMYTSALYGTSKATATLPTFALPTGTTTLTFWLYFDAAPAICNTTYNYLCGTATFTVVINGYTVFTQSASTNAWTKVSLNSQLLAGTSPIVQLIFTSAGNTTYGYTYSSPGAGVFVDDITVTSTCQ